MWPVAHGAEQEMQAHQGESTWCERKPATEGTGTLGWAHGSRIGHCQHLLQVGNLFKAMNNQTFSLLC